LGFGTLGFGIFATEAARPQIPNAKGPNAKKINKSGFGNA
jgi:hypothetical protein